jgi:EAL domain-containing protein (putative c-di-GMP-specific phosphodiesterase class I)
MQLIITGILEKAQADLLLAKGCRLMQGDWLCAPLSWEDLQKKFQPEIA